MSAGSDKCRGRGRPRPRCNQRRARSDERERPPPNAHVLLRHAHLHDHREVHFGKIIWRTVPTLLRLGREGGVRRKFGAALVATVGLLVGPATRADADGCRDAVERYNTAISEISLDLRRYRDCVASSNGDEDCSSELSHLRMAQMTLKAP
jgi:hypothetical protein